MTMIQTVLKTIYSWFRENLFVKIIVFGFPWEIAKNTIDYLKPFFSLCQQ